MKPIKNHTALSLFGWGLLCLGVVCLLFLLFDYFWFNVIGCKTLQDLGSMIASLTGSCFSLAALFLVLDNLKLQRETLKHQQTAIDLQRKDLQLQHTEMQTSNAYFKQQNESLLNQQYQTTFFKLLENHGNHLSALKFTFNTQNDRLQNLYETAEAQYSDYYKTLLSGSFKNAESTVYHPSFIIHINRESFDAYMQELRTIVQLIREKLNKDRLYFEILYNYLTIPEKYWIGVYIDFFENEDSRIIKNSTYNFLAFYDSLEIKPENKIASYFPYVELVSNSTSTEINFRTFKNETNEFLDFKLEIIFDAFSQQISLHNVQVEFVEDNSDTINRQIIKGEELSLKTWPQGMIIELTEACKKSITAPKNGKLTVVFSFKYREAVFAIYTSHRITFRQKSVNPGNDWFVRISKF